MNLNTVTAVIASVGQPVSLVVRGESDAVTGVVEDVVGGTIVVNVHSDSVVSVLEENVVLQLVVGHVPHDVRVVDVDGARVSVVPVQDVKVERVGQVDKVADGLGNEGSREGVVSQVVSVVD